MSLCPYIVILYANHPVGRLGTPSFLLSNESHLDYGLPNLGIDIKSDCSCWLRDDAVDAQILVDEMVRPVALCLLVFLLFLIVPVSRWLGTMFHDVHHSKISCNYGGFTTVWDYLFGTVHRDYDATVNEVVSRIQTSSSVKKATKTE